jgi:hypothetical protein
MHVYEIRPRKDKRGVDLISDALPFGRLWYPQISDAVDHAKFYSRSHDARIRVYDDAGDVIETHEHKGAVQGQGGTCGQPGCCCEYRLLAKNHNVEPALHHREVEIILELHRH